MPIDGESWVEAEAREYLQQAGEQGGEGGYLANFGQDEDIVALVVVGGALLVLGVFLLGKGILHGKR